MAEVPSSIPTGGRSNIFDDFLPSSCQPFIETFEFFYNPSFRAKSWQDPTRIDIDQLQPIECQSWQDPVRIWHEMTNYRKTRLPTYEIVQLQSISTIKTKVFGNFSFVFFFDF